MAQQVQIEGQLQWHFREDRLTKTWIGVCDALKQTALGDSFRDLIENAIPNLIDELLTDLVASNEFDRFLHQRGWKVIGPMPTRLAQDERYKFEVPFELLAEASNGGGGARVAR